VSCDAYVSERKEHVCRGGGATKAAPYFFVVAVASYRRRGGGGGLLLIHARVLCCLSCASCQPQSQPRPTRLPPSLPLSVCLRTHASTLSPTPENGIVDRCSHPAVPPHSPYSITLSLDACVQQLPRALLVYLARQRPKNREKRYIPAPDFCFSLSVRTPSCRVFHRGAHIEPRNTPSFGSLLLFFSFLIFAFRPPPSLLRQRH
jgi:hypothetical protein